jgi:hypothetical protein
LDFAHRSKKQQLEKMANRSSSEPKKAAKSACDWGLFQQAHKSHPLINPFPEHQFTANTIAATLSKGLQPSACKPTHRSTFPTLTTSTCLKT